MDTYNLKKTIILEGYRDKCYVNNILCQMSFEYYNRIKSIISVPLILSTSVMTILNSSDIKASDMKIANIVLNGLTVLILALVNNFKFAEKASNFRSLSLKYNKLCHIIEDKLVYDIDNVSNDVINDIIKEYDSFNELLEYPFPNSIKNTVRKTYKNKKSLPNILNCTTQFSAQPTPYTTFDNLPNNSIKNEPIHIKGRLLSSKSFRNSTFMQDNAFSPKKSPMYNSIKVPSIKSTILFENKQSPIISPQIQRQMSNIKPTESVPLNTIHESSVKSIPLNTIIKPTESIPLKTIIKPAESINDIV